MPLPEPTETLDQYHRSMLAVMAIAYLALHSVWRQIMSGEFSFALLRLLFMIVVIAVAMISFDWGTKKGGDEKGGQL